MTEKKEKTDFEYHGLIFKLWCSKCRNYTQHIVIEGNPVQTISCSRCSHTQVNQIVNNHVKVERGFYDGFERRKQTNNK